MTPNREVAEDSRRTVVDFLSSTWGRPEYREHAADLQGVSYPTSLVRA